MATHQLHVALDFAHCRAFNEKRSESDVDSNLERCRFVFEIGEKKTLYSPIHDEIKPHVW